MVLKWGKRTLRWVTTRTRASALAASAPQDVSATATAARRRSDRWDIDPPVGDGMKRPGSGCRASLQRMPNLRELLRDDPQPLCDLEVVRLCVVRDDLLGIAALLADAV